MSHVDEWGRFIVSVDDIVTILYSGGDVASLNVEPSEKLDRFNKLCLENDRSEYCLQTAEPLRDSPEEAHRKRASRWLICEHLRDIDIREFVLSLCATQEQKDRVSEEMDLFESRGLVPLLKTMICLVDHFRQNNIVWGLGRGSSAASYVLFKIGVHKIDPLKYGLQITEFIR